MKPTAIKKAVWWFISVGLAVITLATALLLCSYKNNNKTTVEPVQFLGTYQLDDSTPPLLLTDNSYIDACKNSSVVFRGSLSDELQKDAKILFYMEYLEVHIYLNGDEIYSWGTEDMYPSFMRSAGAAWGHCILPADISSEDEITIYLESKYTNNYSSAYHNFLASMQTGDSGALARVVLAEHWHYLFIGMMLFLIGLVLELFVAVLAWRSLKIHSSIYYCALFILFASMWILIDPVYSTLLLDNSTLIMLLETVFMWLFSAFLFAYFGTFMQTKAKRANDLLLFLFVGALGVFLVLQLFGVTDAYAVRDFHNLFVSVVGATFLFILCYEVRHAKNSQIRTLALPGLFYLLFGLIEILNYEFEWWQRGVILTVGIAIFIIVLFIFAVRQIRGSLLMALRAVELEKALAESHTAVMLSQIQPHFLYNALTGIKTLCGSDPERAEDAMEHFSYFLRSNLDSLSDTRLITFDKEISHVEDYFYLEKMRFKERVSLVLELEFKDFLLPPLSLQPLVENAVRYGITKKSEGGTVTIKCSRQGGKVLVVITDDGVGFDVDEKKTDGRSHTGIENVRSRLKLQCGGSLTIKSEKNVGTEVQITLPQKENTV